MTIVESGSRIHTDQWSPSPCCWCPRSSSSTSPPSSTSDWTSPSPRTRRPSPRWRCSSASSVCMPPVFLHYCDYLMIVWMLHLVLFKTFYKHETYFFSFFSSSFIYIPLAWSPKLVNRTGCPLNSALNRIVSIYTIYSVFWYTLYYVIYLFRSFWII